ncbi:MAG: glycosyltransferase family 4 protein [Muribaculaceae bacterium]|nr:glycosyltransferase family 4 protein [Muribaculaceae bacterium]
MSSIKSNNWSHVIAVDMPVDERWTFARHLGDLLNRQFHLVWADGRAHVPRWRRIMIYVTIAIKLFFHRRHINLLVCWQQFFGLIFASICQLFHVKKNTSLLVMAFIYRPKPGIIGRIYRWWIHRTLTSGYIDKVLVYSKHETHYYAQLLDVEEQLFQFIPLGIDNVEIAYITDEGFWFSTGKSNRDYAFLINAFANNGHRLLIACDELKQPSAENITVLHNCYDNKMLQVMSRAHGVIIALNDDHISSGQLVILQAMALGKPLIITHSQAIADYVQDGVNALVIDKTSLALTQAVERLNNDIELYNSISASSKKQFFSRHSVKAMAEAIANII